MPIKDLQKAREYKRLWIANKRKQNVEPGVEPKHVEPRNVEPVEPQAGVEPKLDNVEPQHVEPERVVEPCPFNHHSLTDLFHQATTKIKQDYQLIYQDPEASRKCFNCHNLARNYQILLNLLEKYWKLSKKGEKSM